MGRRAIVTACSGDPGYFDRVIEDWWPSLQASSDLAEADAWLMEYGLSDDQRRAADAAGIRVLSFPRNGAVNNLRWRDLPRLLEASPETTHVLMTDGSDIYFQGDVVEIFDRSATRIGAACEHQGELSRDVYLERSRDCLSREELLLCLRTATINSGLLCGPRRDLLDLCHFIAARIPDGMWDVVGPDQCLVHLYLQGEGFEPLEERYNFIPITSRGRPSVLDGRLCVEGRPVHVIHNAGAGFGALADFGYPNDAMRIDWKVLRGLRRKWARYAWMRRIPLLRRRTWGGRMLGEMAPAASKPAS